MAQGIGTIWRRIAQRTAPTARDWRAILRDQLPVSSAWGLALGNAAIPKPAAPLDTLLASPQKAKRRALPTAALLCGLTPICLPAAAAGQMPFEGNWTCQFGTLRMQADRYMRDGKNLQISAIAEEGETYHLTFDTAEQLSLAMNPDGTMTWFSPMSGEGSLCHPQPQPK